MPDIVEAVLGAAGGTAVVVVALWQFAGGVISSHVTEAIRSSNAVQLENFKHQLALVQSRADRYDASRFDLYAELWGALFDLKRAADALWRKADRTTFTDFGQQLVATEVMIGRKRLLLDTEDARVLDEVIEVMTHYRVGKKRLIDYRRENEPIAAYEITRTIEENGDWRARYAAILERVEQQFRAQLQPAR